MSRKELDALVQGVAEVAYTDGYNSGFTAGRDRTLHEQAQSQALQAGRRYAQEHAVDVLDGRLRNLGEGIVAANGSIRVEGATSGASTSGGRRATGRQTKTPDRSGCNRSPAFPNDWSNIP